MVRSAYNLRAITIPFQPCWTLCGHGSYCKARSKCQRRVRMHSKFGRGSNVGMLFPTSAATSLYVMVASIFIGRELVYGRLRCAINRNFVFRLCVVPEGGGFMQ